MNTPYIYNLGIRFNLIASENSDSPALIYKESRTSFSKLESLSNQIAHYLITKSIQSNDVVCILNKKTPCSYATILACIKIGAPYVNLDLQSPPQRIKKIIDTCRPKIILSDLPENETIEKLNLCEVPFELLHDINPKLKKLSPTLPEVTEQIHGEFPAYIMFTSGSTGVPKGAVITHNNALNLIAWARNRFHITSNDIFTGVNPPYFDNSVFDLFASIFNGASLAPINDDIVKQPQLLVDYIDLVKCTMWFSVPSLLNFLLTNKVLNVKNLIQIRTFIFGGEGFPKERLKKLFDLYHKSAMMVNVYGPTECTCICSAYNISAKDFDNLTDLAPLGRLAPNFSYIIDPEDNSNPNYGELCLIGPNVGKGYYNDIIRSSKVFKSCDNLRYFGQSMYCTGDLVELKHDGLLYFKGRKDFQIKRMGYRIELEEIENALSSINTINESAVIYNDMGNGMGLIIGYYTISQNTCKDKILADLNSILPKFMIPDRLIELDELPKNRNGKTDKKALR